MDRGESAPLLLAPPETVSATDVCRTTVQGLLDEWHEQDAMPAVTCLPRALTGQAGRFDFDEQQPRALKRRFVVRPEFAYLGSRSVMNCCTSVKPATSSVR